MKFIILAMSLVTTDWFEVSPEMLNWTEREDCEFFVEHNLIKEEGFAYGCAEIGE